MRPNTSETGRDLPRGLGVFCPSGPLQSGPGHPESPCLGLATAYEASIATVAHGLTWALCQETNSRRRHLGGQVRVQSRALSDDDTDDDGVQRGLDANGHQEQGRTGSCFRRGPGACSGFVSASTMILGTVQGQRPAGGPRLDAKKVKQRMSACLTVSLARD